jgi:hypothetical protein
MQEMNVKNKLEDFAKKYLETIPKVSYEYTLLDTKHSTTIWDSEGCAFVLVSPIDDTIKEFRSQVSSGKSATFRKNISTSLAYKMSESEALCIQHASYC